jgi:Ca-activated chloride channel family protein
MVAVAVVVVAGIGVTSLVLQGGSDRGGSPTSYVAAPPPVIAVPTVLILDASGSMNQADAPGLRIDAAKAAAQGLVDALPDDATLALETYGTSTGSADAEHDAGCADVKTLIPLGRVDRDRMRGGIGGLRASGYTPISLALRSAVGQLPADDSAQAIVLVSDGEDTCGTPPCDEAAQAKRAHPNLAISTVGFKTDGPASDQLRCIADATGGLFVQAGNASQLAARLLATQNIGAAAAALSSDGLGEVRLGQRLVDIRGAHPDFPDASSSGGVVVWRDCDWGFVDGVLDSIAPHGGGRTIDGVGVGTPLSRAAELYGNPVGIVVNGDGSHTVLYAADSDPGSANAFRILVNDFSDAGGTVSGKVKTITICRCKPHASTGPGRPSGVTDDTILSMTFPAGTCGNSSTNWNHTPITVRNGKGEARTASGEFGGASITDAKLAGWLDADGDGTEDAVVTFTCFGSTFDMCCAGRSSMMKFIGVFDFSTPTSPRPVGETIMPGSSPVRGETYGESRYIDQMRIDGSAIITDEKLIYPDTSGATADLGYSPYATIEVTHRFANGQWTSTERVVG